MLLRQFFRFALVGLAGTAVHFGVLSLLVEALNMAPLPASVVGFVGGALANYLLNYHYTFMSRRRHRAALPRFLAIASIGALLNSLLMAAGLLWLQLHYLLAQLLATGLVLLWNFSGSRLWAFRQTEA